ncbi:MAG: septum formation protein Maf [Phycisphaerales bacterium]|nr:septum formation protein Maf [Phycisphaerales bacterium]
MATLILASASPRRRELLAQLVTEFDVAPCTLPEPTRRPARSTPRTWAQALAYFKARRVAERYPDQWVLGADTLVVCGDELFGKPADEAEARRMLIRQAHEPSDVITGVSLVRLEPTSERLLEADQTRVWMRDDEVLRESYLRGGDWAGKAGAYGIQDIGDRLVCRYEGSFSNVVGLPLERLARLLTVAGIPHRNSDVDPTAAARGARSTARG